MTVRERRRSSLLERDSQALVVHVHEQGLEFGVGGDRLHEGGIGRRAGHVVGQDQTARANQGKQLVEVIE